MRDRIGQVRLAVDPELAEALVGRYDRSQTEIGKEFGISQKAIRRAMKQFNLRARKRDVAPSLALPSPKTKPGRLHKRSDTPARKGAAPSLCSKCPILQDKLVARKLRPLQCNISTITHSLATAQPLRPPPADPHTRSPRPLRAPRPLAIKPYIGRVVELISK